MRSALPGLALALCASLTACTGDLGDPIGAPESADASGTGGEPTSGPGAGGDGGRSRSSYSTTETTSTGPSLPPCGCYYGDGLYCADGVVEYGAQNGCDQPEAAAHPGDVLSCSAGSFEVAVSCPGGCYVAPPMVDDGCNASPTGYSLPWACGAKHACTQGNGGDICGSNGGDHVGVQQYAFDFGLPRGTVLRAARAGTVTVAANVVGPGDACYDGCTQPYGSAAFWSCCNACINTSNHVNIDHGDGTVATYWHLDDVTVSKGQYVQRGDPIGHSGTSGCSSGPHLHFQVMGACPNGYCQSIAMSFEDAGVPACGESVTSGNCP